MKGAVIGFGNQGRNHFLAMREAGIEVAAVCDINPKAFAPSFLSVASWATPVDEEKVNLDGVQRYTDYREMLEKERPDIVGVATSDQHQEIVTAAALAIAKGVLCEKPMASSLRAAKAMIEACRATGTVLGINYPRRFWIEHLRMYELIRMGAIGEVRHLSVQSGGARLAALGLHYINWMRWIADALVDSVMGWVDDITEPNPRQGLVDFPGRIDLVFQNGVSGHIVLRKDVALPPWFIVEGVKGRVFIEEHSHRWEIWARPEQVLVGTLDYDGKMEPLPFPVSGRIDWVGMTTSAYRELMEGKVSCSGEDGLSDLEVFVAAHVSHERGRVPVRLPLGTTLERREFPIA